MNYAGYQSVSVLFNSHYFPNIHRKLGSPQPLSTSRVANEAKFGMYCAGTLIQLPGAWKRRHLGWYPVKSH